MTHRQQQEEELEALEAIYSSELELLDRDYPNINLAVHLQSADEHDAGQSDAFDVTLELQLPADYPTIAPRIQVDGLSPLFTDDRIARLHSELVAVAQENLEMPMVFTIISALQEQIGNLVMELKTDREQEKDRAKQKEDDETRRKMDGTKVTVESFLNWKERFNAEQRLLRDKERLAELAALAGKLTGRQLFLRDATLNISDLALIQDDSVQIDESLFEDMDDLELEDESDED